MDGFSLASSSTIGATETSPLQLEVPSQARPINTGEPLPDGHDAVVMIEQVHQPTPQLIELQAAAAPWQHVRLMGEDVVATELLLPAQECITPLGVAALVAAQVRELEVLARPRVALVPTGGEVVPAGTEPEPGQVIDYDTPLLQGMVEAWGGQAIAYRPTPDDPAQLRKVLAQATRDADVVAFIAGSSAGTADHVPNLIESMGELLFHGLRLSPGKPAALGCVNQVPVIGVPGYSVAAWMAFDLLAKPIIYRLQGRRPPRRPEVRATIKRKLPSRPGVREYRRVRLGRVGGEVVAVPLKGGASALSSLVQADGLAIIPELHEGVSPGESLPVQLLVSPDDIERTILAVGSHDIALDLLGLELAQLRPALRLASIHVGSMGGLRALLQGEAHLAGIHLLDPGDGNYNESYIRRVMPDLPLRLVHLAWREVGLMVAPGNPKGIRAIEDLGQPGVVLINRQRGAGTRVLLDHLLDRAGLKSSQLAGYQREVTTHTMVAAAISGGAADVGLGLGAAARALGLDFIPITTERYDLAIPSEQFEQPAITALVKLLRRHNSPLRERAKQWGGYDFTDSGNVVYEQ
jgi:putative molybdopterin biosynthesis protein